METVGDPLCTSTEVDLHADDPDIAGPGVLIGFMLTSILTMILSYFTLWLHHVEDSERGPTLLRLFSLKGRSGNPAKFWIPVLEGFVLSLSDQQLITGILLLVCAYGKYWEFSVRCGGNNLWNAADIVCFSSLTHVATLLTLRGYFRRHRLLAFFRVCAMYIVYIMWLAVIVHILKPNHKTNERPKLPTATGKFWHAASYIEAIGVFWLYLITYLPIFLSDEATKVRIAIARNSNDLPAALDAWHSSRPGHFRPFSWTHILHPYKLVRSYNTRFAIKFSTLYQRSHGWTKMGMWITAELLFPWYFTPILLGTLYAFGLGFMCFKVHTNELSTDWSFGQLLPVFLVLLPVQTLIGTLADAKTSITK